MPRVKMFLLQHFSWIFALAIILPIVIFVPAFQKAGYWLALNQQYFAAAALALALTPIMITGGIDLSVGSITVMVSVVIGALWRDAGWPLGWAIGGGILIGLVAGLVNSAMVFAGVLPLVATLATRELYRGLAMRLSGDHPVDRFPIELVRFWRSTWLGLPIPLYVLIALVIFAYFIVQHTWIGRMTYAIGDNEQAARFAGIPVSRIKMLLYGGSGLVAGLCGAALVMKYGAAKADAERSLELSAIAYVVVGGIRITGGAGTVTGTVIGILTVSALLAWLDGAAPNWRDTIIGTLLIVVAISNELAARWLLRSQTRSV